MRLAGAFFAATLLVITQALWAGAPMNSLRPKPRIVSTIPEPVTTTVRVFYRSTIRPKPRLSARSYQSITDISSQRPDQVPNVTRSTIASTIPVFRSPRPLHRPGNLNTTRTRVQPRQSYAPKRVASTAPVALSGVGRICGDARIIGERIAPIKAELPGCGVASPVRVASIDGVVLGQASIMDCTTARALTNWVAKGLKPAFSRRGGGVKSLSVASHYSCRTRNSQPGAKISEHGKGRAIDISAINLHDGRKITVLAGWPSRSDGQLLKRVHRAACGPFGTVLGPEANRFHKDHFHFDTARYRSGPYCE